MNRNAFPTSDEMVVARALIRDLKITTCHKAYILWQRGLVTRRDLTVLRWILTDPRENTSVFTLQGIEPF